MSQKGTLRRACRSDYQQLKALCALLFPGSMTRELWRRSRYIVFVRNKGEAKGLESDRAFIYKASCASSGRTTVSLAKLEEKKAQIITSVQDNNIHSYWFNMLLPLTAAQWRGSQIHITKGIRCCVVTKRLWTSTEWILTLGTFHEPFAPMYH